MITYLYNKIHFNDATLLLILFALLCGFIKKISYVLIIVLLHEMGHVLICLLFNYKIIKVEIYPFGGITKIDKHLNDSFFHDVILASGGIIVQLIIMFLGYINIINDSFFLNLNFKILLFNLIPIIPLDGAKILFEVINKFTSFYHSINYYVLLSFFSILLFIYYNLNNLIDCYVIIILCIQKTLDIYKERHLLINKFILERKLYHLRFNHVKCQNTLPINYHKDTKYYYKINGTIIDDYSFLNNMIK